MQTSLALRNMIVDRATPDTDNEVNLIKSYIERGKRQIFCEPVRLSPTGANYLLQLNPDNRRMKANLVNLISLDMKEDRFPLNGETVIISSCGYVNDGQNRLQAIVKSGRSVTLLVAFGLPRETRGSVDSNQASRTTSDYLKMQGVEKSTEVGRIGSVLLSVQEFGCLVSNRSLRPQDVNKYSLDHLEEIETSMEVVTKQGGRLVNYQAMCALYVMIARKAGDEAASSFMRSLQQGVGLSSSNPIYILRERLQREKALNVKAKRREYMGEMMEMIIRGWNHYRNNTSPSKMQVMGKWPEISR